MLVRVGMLDWMRDGEWRVRGVGTGPGSWGEPVVMSLSFCDAMRRLHYFFGQVPKVMFSDYSRSDFSNFAWQGIVVE